MKIDVSIIIITYNYASYLGECINSCLLQNDSSLRFEVIVVDDGSTDETPLILSRINSKALRKFRIENSGIEVASNFGFLKSLGKYVVRVDADDKLLPDYLRCMQDNLAIEYDFYYSNYDVINAEGQVISRMNLPAFNITEIQTRGDFLATGTLYSIKALKASNFYSEEIKNSGLENYELILKLINNGSVGKLIQQSLFCYRRHAFNISVSRIAQIECNGFSLFRRLGLGRYSTNEYHPYNPNLG